LFLKVQKYYFHTSPSSLALMKKMLNTPHIIDLQLQSINMASFW